MSDYPKYIVVNREGDHGIVMATHRLFTTASEAYDYVLTVDRGRIAIVVEVKKPFYENERERRIPMPKEIPERFKVHEDPDKMVFINPGDPIPEIMIRLPNGTLVPKSVYGEPPADLPLSEYQTWIADRSFQLMSGGEPNWPVDSGDDDEPV